MKIYNKVLFSGVLAALILAGCEGFLDKEFTGRADPDKFPGIRIRRSACNECSIFNLASMVLSFGRISHTGYHVG